MYRGIVPQRHAASLLPLNLRPPKKQPSSHASHELALLYLPEIDQCSIALLSFSYS
jgi:hypothetical protein